MKKVIFFLLNRVFSESHAKPFARVVITTVIGAIVTMIPFFWMGRAYNASILPTVSSYLFIPFGIFAAILLFIGTPFMYYAGTQYKVKGTKAIAIFMGIFPGTVTIGLPLERFLHIPNGLWNIPIMIIASILYLNIVSSLFKKYFANYYPNSTFVS